MSVSLSYVWIFLLENPSEEIAPDYYQDVIMFALSAVVEMLSEPFFVTAQILLFIKLRVSKKSKPNLMHHSLYER